MSHQKIYTFLYSVVNDEVPSTSSRIVEQIEDIQEVDIHRVHLGRMTQNYETRKPRTVFFKKYFRKRKMDLILPIIFAMTPFYGSCYRVIDTSGLQEFFSSGPKCYHAM